MFYVLCMLVVTLGLLFIFNGLRDPYDDSGYVRNGFGAILVAVSIGILGHMYLKEPLLGAIPALPENHTNFDMFIFIAIWAGDILAILFMLGMLGGALGLGAAGVGSAVSDSMKRR